MRHPSLAVVLLTVVVAGCASATVSPVSPGTSTPTSAVASAETAVPSAPPSTTPEPTAKPTAAPSAGPGLDDWTTAELFLLAGVDKKIRTTCGKAPKLPENAYDGIQCKPKGIASIGFYVFDDRHDMRKLYFDRLAEYGIKPDGGEACNDAKPGEGTDTPGNDTYEYRIGCYIDETGAANVRMSMPAEQNGQSVYVGVVGDNGSLDDLLLWLFPDREPTTGCGFCIAQTWEMPGEYHP